MSEEQKLQYFLDKNPEFTRMVDEYKEKVSRSDENDFHLVPIVLLKLLVILT